MTATEAKWSERVREWRESGLTAREFSTARGFSAGGLRHWAHKLSRRQAGVTTPPATAKPSPSPGRSLATVEKEAPMATGVRVLRVERRAAEAPLVIEVGAARMSVAAGADVALVRATLEALLATTSRGAR
jgi:hypothetical protein